MNQIPIFQGDEASHLASVAADVEAAGGYQVVGHRLGYNDDPITAGKILSNKLNTRQAKAVLSSWDEKRIRLWARETSGKSQSFADEAATLAAEVTWKTSEMIAQEQITRVQSARDLLQLELSRTEDLLRKLAK